MVPNCADHTNTEPHGLCGHCYILHNERRVHGCDQQRLTPVPVKSFRLLHIARQPQPVQVGTEDQERSALMDLRLISAQTGQLGL